MELLIGAAALVVVALLAKSSPAAPPPKPKKDPSQQALEDGAKAIAAAAGLLPAGAGAVAAGVTGLVAGAAVGGYVGAQITHDAPGVAIGAYFPLVQGTAGIATGAAVNLGRAGGMELDRALGGTGGGVSGVIAQGGGGGAALAFVTSGGILAGTVIIAVAPIYALVRGIGAAISDEGRRQWAANGGARDEYEAKWKTRFDATYDSLVAAQKTAIATAAASRTKDQAQIALATLPQLRQTASAFADGFMTKANALAWSDIMHRPHGVLGVTDHDHCQFFADRGAFLGSCNAVGGLFDAPPFKTLPPYWSSDIGAGMDAANIAAYVNHMTQDPLGAFQSWTQHVSWGLDHGLFEGAPDLSDGEGRLIYQAHVWDWHKYAGGA